MAPFLSEASVTKPGPFLYVPLREVFVSTLASSCICVMCGTELHPGALNGAYVLEELSTVRSSLLFSQFEFVFIANSFCGHHSFHFHFKRTFIDVIFVFTCLLSVFCFSFVFPNYLGNGSQIICRLLSRSLSLSLARISALVMAVCRE